MFSKVTFYFLSYYVTTTYVVLFCFLSFTCILIPVKHPPRLSTNVEVRPYMMPSFMIVGAYYRHSQRVCQHRTGMWFWRNTYKHGDI